VKEVIDAAFEYMNYMLRKHVSVKIRKKIGKKVEDLRKPRIGTEGISELIAKRMTKGR
jgi:hypothetical protein